MLGKLESDSYHNHLTSSKTEPALKARHPLFTLKAATLVALTPWSPPKPLIYGPHTCLQLLSTGTTYVTLHQDISRTIERIGRCIGSWKEYSQLWRSDRAQVLERFKARCPPTAAYEAKLAHYAKVRG